MKPILSIQEMNAPVRQRQRIAARVKRVFLNVILSLLTSFLPFLVGVYIGRAVL